MVYEQHIAQVKEEVSQLKSRLMELVNLVKDVVSYRRLTRPLNMPDINFVFLIAAGAKRRECAQRKRRKSTRDTECGRINGRPTRFTFKIEIVHVDATQKFIDPRNRNARESIARD